MKASFMKGVGFGITSGIITTLGMIVGLHSSTHSKAVVLGGILIIAVADALSDALGMHISEESSRKTTSRHIWEATGSTFLTKLIIACSFIIPILLFGLSTAIIVSIAWGLSLIAGFSYYIAVKQDEKPLHVISEHLIIAIVVIVVTHLLGDWVAAWS